MMRAADLLRAHSITPSNSSLASFTSRLQELVLPLQEEEGETGQKNVA